MIDLSRDAHVHTAFAAGHDSVSVARRRRRGGRHHRADVRRPGRVRTPVGCRSYIATIQRAQKRTDVVLRRGVEVEAIGVDGWLAFPSDLGQLEVISLGVSRLPTPAGLLGPDLVRAQLDSGALAADEVADRLVGVLCLAMERVGRYAPTTLARPLEFLARGRHRGVHCGRVDPRHARRRRAVAPVRPSS